MGKALYLGRCLQASVILTYGSGTFLAANSLNEQKNIQRYVGINQIFQGILLYGLCLGEIIANRTFKILSARFFGAGMLTALIPQLLKVVVRSEYFGLRYIHWHKDKVQREHVHTLLTWGFVGALIAAPSARAREVMGFGLGLITFDRFLFAIAPTNYLGAVGE